MRNSPNFRNRPQTPESLPRIDVAEEGRRRLWELSGRVIPVSREVREAAEYRRSRETPVTPWQRGSNYDWIRMQNGTSYAVFDDGTVKVSIKNGRPFAVGASMTPPAVQEKYEERLVAMRAASEGGREQLSWQTRTQPRTGLRYDYIVSATGDRYAVFHDSLIIRKFRQNRGIVTVGFRSAPAFVQEHVRAMQRGQTVPVPQIVPTSVPQRPRTDVPAPSAPTENPRSSPRVSENRPAVPEAPSGPEAEVTPAQVLDAIRQISFTESGRVIPVALPSSFGPTYLMKMGIPDADAGEYLRNVQTAAARLQNAMPSSGGGRISFNGNSFILERADGRKIVATPQILFSDIGRPQGSFVDADGTAVLPRDPERGLGVMQIADRTEYTTTAGSLRMRRYAGYTEYYDGGRENRPSTILVTSRADVRIGNENYPLRPGIYFVPESGAPIGRFENGVNAGPSYSMTPEDTRRAQEYADQVVKALKTPEAITAFVTSNFDFVARGGLSSGAVRGVPESSRAAQDIQHPLRTIFLASGDCEDFAVLLQYLCGRARQLDPETGAASFLAKTYETHNSAYYLEEYTAPDGSKAYTLCKMHVHGFERIRTGPGGQPFRTPQEAMRSIWTSRKSPSAVHAEISALQARIDRGEVKAADVDAYMQTLRQMQRQGGGLILMEKDLSDVNDRGAAEGAARFDADFSAFIRK
jgi:hypothetical protein